MSLEVHVNQSSIRVRSGSINKWMAVLGFAIYIWFVAGVDDADDAYAAGMTMHNAG